MVDRGGDIMLGGHAHTYERWLPLDMDQVPVTEGLTEFVVGTGGRPILNAKHPDDRTAADITTPGALLLDLGDTDAGYTFVSADGKYTGHRHDPVPDRTKGRAEVTSTLPGDDGLGTWRREGPTGTSPTPTLPRLSTRSAARTCSSRPTSRRRRTPAPRGAAAG